MSYSSDFFGNGFQSGFNEYPTIKVNVREEVDAFLDIPDDEIVYRMVNELAYEMVKAKCFNLHKYIDHANLKSVYQMQVTTCTPKFNYVSIEEKMFKVNGVAFTQEEMIAAIKEQYPERLI